MNQLTDKELAEISGRALTEYIAAKQREQDDWFEAELPDACKGCKKKVKYICGHTSNMHQIICGYCRMPLIKIGQ